MCSRTWKTRRRTSAKTAGGNARNGTHGVREDASARGPSTQRAVPRTARAEAEGRWGRTRVEGPPPAGSILGQHAGDCSPGESEARRHLRKSRARTLKKPENQEAKWERDKGHGWKRDAQRVPHVERVPHPESVPHAESIPHGVSPARGVSPPCGVSSSARVSSAQGVSPANSHSREEGTDPHPPASAGPRLRPRHPPAPPGGAAP